MKKKILLGMAGLAALASGCETVASDDIATDAVYAQFAVNADGSGNAHVSGTLRTGGPNSNTFLDLTENDALIAYAGPASQSMSKDNNLGAISYHANFVVTTGGVPFKVSFLRTHAAGQECNGVSAPNSDVVLPEPFAITGPNGSPPYSRTTEDIVLTWAPSGTSDQMYWSASGPCISPTGDTAITGDTGTYTIAAGTLVGGTAGSCTISIGIERLRTGTIDPAYGEGGSMYAKQNRSITVQSTP